MKRLRRHKDDEELVLEGPFKRNLPIIVTLVLGFGLGPFFGELIEEYRAIVLEVRAEQVFLGWGDNKPPSWEAYQMGSPGDVLVKRLGSLSLSLDKPGELDSALVKLHKRYTERYSGVVKALEAPLHQGSPHIAIITLSSGEELRLPVWDEELAETIAVGRKVEKTTGGWDPKVVLDPEPPVVRMEVPKGKGKAGAQ